MRLNKFISHNTGYSRREADELIKNGKVSVNGRIISDFIEINESDKIRINKHLYFWKQWRIHKTSRFDQRGTKPRTSPIFWIF